MKGVSNIKFIKSREPWDIDIHLGQVKWTLKLKFSPYTDEWEKESWVDIGMLSSFYWG